MGKRLSQKKKIAFSAALSLLTLLVLFWLVFRNHYKEILHNIYAASTGGLVWILIMGLAYPLLESMICRVLVKRKIKSFSFRQALEVTLLGVFGNVATLSVGSLPMQSAYLHRRGMALGEAAGIMSMEYVLHKSSVLLCGGILLLLGGQDIFQRHQNLLPYILFGYLVCIAIIVLLILVCTWKRFYQLTCKGILQLGKVPEWTVRADRLKLQADALYVGARDLLHAPKVIWASVGINALKLLSLYSVPYLCAEAIGLNDLSFIQVQVLSALTHVISNALPNIAGMGSVEAAFLLLFSQYMNPADASSVLILYRLSTYFVPFLISAFVTEKIGLRLCAADGSGVFQSTSDQEEKHGIS